MGYSRKKNKQTNRERWGYGISVRLKRDGMRNFKKFIRKQKFRNFYEAWLRKTTAEFPGLWVIFFFLSEFPRGVTHFSRISGQDLTTFFLAIPWVKFTNLEIPEGVFKNPRPQLPYWPNLVCLSLFFLWNISIQSFSYSDP